MNFPNFKIKLNGNISKAFLKIKINNFQQACEYIKNIRYQRISVKSNLLLVLEEKRGTCSSKHALLKKLAEENNINDIELKIGIYKMTAKNTPGLENLIPKNISFIPEAHAYLVFYKNKLDFTRINSKPLQNEDILKEISLTADEMISKKDQIHKNFMKKWCQKNNLDFNKIWLIRESCIKKLST